MTTETEVVQIIENLRQMVEANEAKNKYIKQLELQIDRMKAAEARERVLREALIEAHKALWVSGWDNPLRAKIDAALSAHKED